MHNLYIIRHGETSVNIANVTQCVHNDVHCTDEAMQELRVNAREFVKTLSKKVVLLCSPMLRAKETAEEIMHACIKHHSCLQYEVIDALQEVDFGDFGGKPDTEEVNGLTMTDYRKATAKYYRQGDSFKFPNGESSDDISKRVSTVIYDTVRDRFICNPAYDDYDVILVGHNRFFRHVLAELGMTKPDMMFAAKLPHAQLINVPLDTIM